MNIYANTDNEPTNEINSNTASQTQEEEKKGEQQAAVHRGGSVEAGSSAGTVGTGGEASCGRRRRCIVRALFLWPLALAARPVHPARARQGSGSWPVRVGRVGVRHGVSGVVGACVAAGRASRIQRIAHGRSHTRREGVAWRHADGQRLDD